MSSPSLDQPIQMLPPYKVLSRVSILSETLDYNHKMMNIPAIWRTTKGAVNGEGVPGVILDSGVPNHVDLRPDGGKSFIPGYKEDKNGHGCVAPDTLVHTNFCGIEQIETLYERVEAPLVSWESPNGEKSPAKDVRGMGLKTLSFDVEKGKTAIGDIEFLHKTPVAGDVILLNIEGGGQMKLTPWHPVPVQRRNSHGTRYYEKVRADRLVVGDNLIAPSTTEWVSDRVFSFKGVLKWGCTNCEHTCVQKRPHSKNSERRCSQCGKRNALKSFVPSYDVTEDLAYLMGLIFTDGSITKTSKSSNPISIVIPCMLFRLLSRTYEPSPMKAPTT